MSYLLGYQKWRKLHESAKYGKLYEQAAFVKGSKNITSIVLAGTSKTPIMESTHSAKYGLTAAKGKTTPSLYEISLKDALAQNFGAATFVKALGANEPKDQFIILKSGAEIDKKVGTEQKITFTKNEENLNSLTIRFAGNGVLCMHRASTITKTIPQDKFYHVRLYMGFDGTPVADLDLGENSPRFAISIGLDSSAYRVETFFDSLISSVMLVYIAKDPAMKKELYDNAVGFFKGFGPERLYKSVDDINNLKKYPLPMMGFDGKLVFLNQEEYVDDPIIIEAKDRARTNEKIADPNFSGNKAAPMINVHDLFAMADVSDSGSAMEEADRKKKWVQTGPLFAAIHQYLNNSASLLVRDGGVIDMYFNSELKGLEPDLIQDLKESTKTSMRAMVSSVVNGPRGGKTQGKGRIHYSASKKAIAENIYSSEQIGEMIRALLVSEGMQALPPEKIGGQTKAEVTKSTYGESNTGTNTQTSSQTQKGPGTR